MLTAYNHQTLRQVKPNKNIEDETKKVKHEPVRHDVKRINERTISTTYN
jgi:hypothetical protein